MPTCLMCGGQEPRREVHRVLVLSGGGGKGIYEAAWIKTYLDENEVDFDGFVGISAGSLNAAYLAGASMAAGFGSAASIAALRERARRLLELWESVRNHRGVYHGDLKSKLQVLFRVVVCGNPGALDPAPIRAMIDTHIRARDVSLSGRRLLVGATQLDTGAYVELCEQCPALAEGVKASTAIPAAFPPVWLPDGRRYVDGAIRNNTPLSSGYRMKPSIELVAVQTTPLRIVDLQEARLEADIPPSSPQQDRNALDILSRVARIMSEEVQKDDVEGAWRYNLIARAGGPLPAGKAAIPTRVWAPPRALLDDEKIFEWEDLCGMRDQGAADARGPARLAF